MPRPTPFKKIEMDINSKNPYNRKYTLIDAPIITIKPNEYHHAHIEAWYSRRYKKVKQGAAHITKQCL